MNLTTMPFEKSGIKYELLNGVYLNFRNLAQPLPHPHKRFNQYDGKFNEVRFKGPLTLDELDRLRRTENIQKLTDWMNK